MQIPLDMIFSPSFACQDVQLLTPLNAFGSSVLLLMMVFYLMESKSPKYTLLFGMMCIGSSAYGFMAGTWPFGVIEAVWALFAFNKFIKIISARNKVN